MKINLRKIEQFYQSGLGDYARQSIHRALVKITPTSKIKNTVCICSAGVNHYASILNNHANRLAFQSYDDQDIWPDGGTGHYIVCDRAQWPYRAEDPDYVVMTHDLEFAENPEVYLREAWRVLKGEGHLIIVVPNRSGKWAKYDNNPFGKGYPYTIDQIKNLLARAHFAIDHIDGVLFYPASNPKTKLGLWARQLADSLGTLCFMQPGVFIICASKHIYAPTTGLKATATQKAQQALFPKTITSTNPKTPSHGNRAH
jgi:SAM-dependent methyltransferase